MRYLICGLIMSVTAVVAAQERAVGVALERFSVLAGAWWLNQKCSLLSTEEEAAFKRDVAVVNASLATTLDNPKLVLSIQASGKRVAESERYASCGTQAQEIVQYGASAARQWSNEIRTTVLEAAIQLPGAPR